MSSTRMLSSESSRRLGPAIRSLGVLVLCSLSTASLAGSMRVQESTPSDLERAQALLDEGKAEDALITAEAALESDPENPALLVVAALSAGATDQPDLALWYADIALDQLGEGTAGEALTERLQTSIAQWDAVAREHADLEKEYEDFVQELYGLGRGCASRKLYVNAVDLFLRCEGTRFDARASRELEKLYGARDSASAILDYGLDLPAPPMTEKQARRMALSDAKHESWENAYEKKTGNYTVVTNMGDGMAERLSVAMEQMNRAYRRVFATTGKTTRCTIQVFRTRKEFDQMTGMSRNVRGFFSPSESKVVTYDPRTENPPGSLESLWSTLFHEASHQFTHEISKTLVPGWLNEGTASYFEGARLMPNGTVVENGIPDGRLRNLKRVLERGAPRVQSVLSYYQPGSYEGTYYPVGWGLVYFLHNWEDEKCERPYVKQYERYLRAYRKGDRHDVLGRFTEFFVKNAKIDGIDTLDAFIDRFQHWMIELHDDYFGPAEKAEKWLALARKRRSFDKKEAALEAYRYALRKDPESIPALFEIAELQYELKLKDPAVLNLRKALDIIRRLPEEEPVPELQKSGNELLEECLQRLQRYDQNLAKGLRRAAMDFRATADAVARAYFEGGYPRRALGTLDDAIALMGGDVTLERLRDEFALESGVDVRRTRTLSFADDLEGWVVDSEGIAPQGDSMRTLFHSSVSAKSYRLSVRAEVSDSVPFGLVFGDDQRFGSLGLPRLFHFSFEGEEFSPRDLGPFSPVPCTVELALEVSPHAVEFFVDGTSLERVDRPSFQKSGRIGLYGTQGVRFTALRLVQ